MSTALPRNSDFAKAQLTSAQRTVIRYVAESPLVSTCYLTGGTALAAFYLGHRVSDDVDFFSKEEVPLLTLQRMIASWPAVSVDGYQQIYDRRLFLLRVGGESLKAEFVRYPFPRITPLLRVENGLSIDSLEDIFANKLVAMVDRHEPKDDADVYFLLRERLFPDFASAISAAERKFGIPGLRFSLQSRLLNVSTDLPPTVPPITREEVAAAFRKEVERLVAADITP